MRWAALVSMLGSVLVAGLARAHDYWIEPVAGDGGSWALHMLVGEALVSEEERAMQLDRTVRFLHVSSGGEEDLLAASVDGATPFASVAPSGEGGHFYFVERAFSAIELPADRFERYLRAEGLGAVVRERRHRHESDLAGRERYARCLVALVRLGDAADAVYATDPGCRIAIVPESDPSLALPREHLGFTVRFDAAPLADATVDLYLRDEGGRVRHRRVTTDDGGHARVRIPSAGYAVLRSVTMVRSSDETVADWESWWTSYAFTVRPE